MNPLKVGTKVFLGKDTRTKASIIGYFMAIELNGKPQMYYLARIKDPVLFNGLAMSVLVLHPDNVYSLHDENQAIARELEKGTYNFGQSDGSGFQVKTNAPESQINLILFEMRKHKRDVTPKRIVKRLKRKGWVAEQVKEALI